jgi:acyl carrier protein
MQRTFRDVFDDDALELRQNITAADVEQWDSLSHINLIVALEREFKVKFTTAEVMTLKNVGDLEVLLIRKRGSQG